MKVLGKDIGGFKWPGGFRKMPALFAFLSACVLLWSTAAHADITNTATAQGTYNSTNYNSVPASAAVPVTPAAPAIGLVKPVGVYGDFNGNGLTDAGDHVSYTFTVTNTGNVTLTGVGVTDPKVSGITCAATTLAPGASTSCTGAPYTLVQADIDAGQVQNQASASGISPKATVVTDDSDPISPNPGQNNKTFTPLSTVPAISILKTVASFVDVNGNGITDANDKIKYSFTVKNIGPLSLHGIAVTDTKVSGITCVATSLAPGGTTTCSGSDYLISQADVDAGNVANQATVNALTPSNTPVSDLSDPSTYGSGPGNDDITNAPIPPQPSIGLVKTAGSIVDANSNGVTDVNDTITYSFKVFNLGNVTLSGIAVTDPKVPSITCPATSLLPGTNMTCTAAAPYALTQADIDAGQVSNKAHVASKSPTGVDVTDDSDPTTPGAGSNNFTIAPIPQTSTIGIVKAAGAFNDLNANGRPDLNETITYSFTVKNLGNVTLTTVAVTDPKVSGITCAATTLLPGQSTTCAGADYSITQADIDAGKATNQAKVTSKNPGGVTVSDDSHPTTSGPGSNAPTDTSLTQKPDIGLVKPPGVWVDKNSNGLIDPLDELAYTFIVTNLGNVTLSAVSVTDSKVSGITCAATTLAPGASTSCTGANYVITLADVNAGQVTNTATVSSRTPSGQPASDVSDQTTPGQTNNTDTITNLTPTPRIGLVKAAGALTDVNGNGFADLGDTITYSFIVSNIGNLTLHGITVTDNKVSPVTCSLTTLNPGQSTTCTAPLYTITQVDVDAGMVQNTATADGLSPSNQPVSDISDPSIAGPGADNPTVTPLPPAPAVGLVKTAGAITDANSNGKTDVGDKIPFTFTVTNLGNVTLGNLVVTDPKVSGITCAAATLAPTLSTTCGGTPYSLTQVDLDAGIVTNQALVTAKPPTGANVTDKSDEATPGTGLGKDDPTSTSIPQAPAIGLVKPLPTYTDANGNGLTDANDKLTYTFTVSNLGNVTLNPVSVTDLIPALNPVTCAATSLAPGASTTCTAPDYVITPADMNNGQVTNTATATGKPPFGVNVTDGSDPNTPGPAANAPTVMPLTPFPAVSIVKTAGAPIDNNGNGVIDANDTINYSFSVKNTGTVALNSIGVTDTILGAVTCASTTLAAGATTSCTAAAHTISQADMDAGKVSNQATVNATPSVGAAVSDLSDESTFGSGLGHDDPTVVPLPSTPKLMLVKSTTFAGPPIAGTTINYTFKVTNTGPVTINNITLSDPNAVASGGPIAALAPGVSDSTTFTAAHVIAAADITAGTFTNTGTVTGQPATPGSQPVSGSSSVTTSLTYTASMSMTKTGALTNTVNPPQANDLANYTFVVTNTGNTTLTNISISDPIVQLGSLEDSQRNIALLDGALKSQADFATADVSPVGAGGAKSGAVEAAKRRNMAVLPAVVSELRVKRTLVRMSGGGELQPGDKIGFLFALTNAGDQPLTDITIAQPDANAYGDKLSLLLPNQTDAATVIYTRDVTPEEIAEGVVRSNSFVLAHARTREMMQVLAEPLLVSEMKSYDNFITASISPATIASLAPGASATFTAPYHLRQVDIDAGKVFNTATANATDINNKPISVVSAFNLPLTQAPKIGVVKTGVVNPGADNTLTAGDSIIYSFAVTNLGNVTLNQVALSDPKVSLSGGPIASLAPGATNSTTFTATHVLTQADINAGHYDNQATTSGKPPIGQNVNATSDFADPNQHRPTVVPLSRIGIVKKVASVTPVRPGNLQHAGDVITYQFTIFNLGNEALSNITVTDPLMPGTGGNVISGGPVASLAPTTSTTAFTGTYTITQTDVDKGEVRNTATVSGFTPGGVRVQDDSDPEVPTGNNPTIQNLPQGPSIGLKKVQVGIPDDVNGNGLVDAGDVIHYTFEFQNNGNVTLSNFQLQELLQGAQVGNGPVVLKLDPSQSNGTMFTATYTIKPSDEVAGQVSNQAQITADGPPGSQSTAANSDNSTLNAANPAPTVTTVDVHPAIAVIKLAPTLRDANGNPTAIADAGGTLTYQITVRNTGNTVLNNVSVIDLNALDVVSGGPLASLAIGAEDTTTFTAVHVVTAADITAGFYDNQVRVTSQSPNNATVTDLSDSASYANDSKTHTVLNHPVMTVAKTDTVKDVNGDGINDAGDVINYTITIANTGNVALTNVAVTDPNGGIANPVIVTPNLAVGQSIVYNGASHVITAAEAFAGSYTNTATVDGTFNGGAQITLVSNPDKTILAVTPPVLTKSADHPQVKRGEQVGYTITASNLGPGPYNITDIMPPGFGYVAGSAQIAVGTGGAPVVNGASVVFNPLTPNAGKITIKLKLLASTTLSGGKFVNNARIIDPANGKVLGVAQATVEVVPEPVFDCSDIIGRVFDDKNANGYMDDGEPGLPGVRLVTLNGLVITTDAEGKYHVPCAAIPDPAIGSNFLLKLDPRTLPTGYHLTTENPRDVRVTRGKVVVLNFGASILHDVKVDVNSHAFDGDGIDLISTWDKGIGRLCKILKKNRAELMLVYHQGGESGELAQARLDGLEALVRKRCDAGYPLKIKKAVEEGK